MDRKPSDAKKNNLRKRPLSPSHYLPPSLRHSFSLACCSLSLFPLSPPLSLHFTLSISPPPTIPDSPISLSLSQASHLKEALCQHEPNAKRKQLSYSLLQRVCH